VRYSEIISFYNAETCLPEPYISNLWLWCLLFRPIRNHQWGTSKTAASH